MGLLTTSSIPSKSTRLVTGALLALMLASSSSCRQKSYAPFYELEGQQDRLVSREGDDAYVSDELAPILSALEAVPEGVKEKPRAVALVAHLKAEQARVKAARAPPPPPPPTRPPWGGGAIQRPGVGPDLICLNACRAKEDQCLHAHGCGVTGNSVTCTDVSAAQAACATELRCRDSCKQ